MTRILVTSIGIVLLFACAYGCEEVADRRGRDAYVWLGAGLLFGPVALLALVLLPRRV